MSGIRRAAKILREGGLVAFPTETVYGLGADASNAVAVARLYAAKRRPAAHPVIVHFASAREAFSFARAVPERAWMLARRFWPGPLTLILKRAPRKAKDFVTGGQDTVGLRVPSHPVARRLLRAFAGAIAAPSANVFGRVSATTAAHVREDLGREADLVLDAGPSEIGIESTIVDLSGDAPRLLRPGFISKAQLEAVLKTRLRQRQSASPRHPGGLARHYAPRTPARLVASHELDREIARRRKKIALLAFARPDERVEIWRRMPRDPAGYGRRLYAALRELDAAGCDLILVESPPEDAEWSAVRDRLRRATA